MALLCWETEAKKPGFEAFYLRAGTLLLVFFRWSSLLFNGCSCLVVACMVSRKRRPTKSANKKPYHFFPCTKHSKRETEAIAILFPPFLSHAFPPPSLFSHRQFCPLFPFPPFSQNEQRKQISSHRPGLHCKPRTSREDMDKTLAIFFGLYQNGKSFFFYMRTNDQSQNIKH